MIDVISACSDQYSNGSPVEIDGLAFWASD